MSRIRPTSRWTSIRGGPDTKSPTPQSTDVVVIGAGHAGLASSYVLNRHAIEHVVLERAELANSWKNERWDSLTLLTPNWQSRLPGFAYDGDDPDGFMTMPEVVAFIEAYAAFSNAPVRTRAEVTEVTRNDSGYRVASTAGDWQCRAVIVASGACNIASVPECAGALPHDVTSLTPQQFRNADQLAPGGVLIVGASASGLQIAHEIQASGRDVTVATGEHVRMPRRYRGRDIQFWLDRTGILDERYDEIDDINRARSLPSPQLIGAHEPQILDLNRLTGAGARLVGRLMGFRGNVALFSGSLKNVCALADLKMNRMLDTIDEWLRENPEAVDPVNGNDAADGRGALSGIGEPERFAATRVDRSPAVTLDLRRERIHTIVWCTGFRPDYRWLNVGVMDRKGRIQHDGGVAQSPGLYVIGLPVLRRRKSSFIHGTEDDANDLVEHLAAHLDGRGRRASQH